LVAIRCSQERSRYTVLGHRPGYGGGTGVCRAAEDAQITAGTTIALDPYCSMR